MAELTRRFDWTATPLGAVEEWPDVLVTVVNMLLASRHPMFLWWGDELIQFYNDAYRPSIREDKHPKALGQRGTECWPEIWEIIGPQIHGVMSRGESTWNENQLVPIHRNGKPEEVYWTYGYSPVRDKDGAVQGTLVVCNETTEQVLSERRLRAKVAERTVELEAEIADRERAENSLRALTARLLQTQDEERRHMARELHDHAGQTLVALSLNLHQMQQAAQGRDEEIAQLAREGQQLSDDLSKEIRTLSYLLHPPLLDEAGLFSALGWYVDGFSKRSGVRVELSLPQGLGRLPRDLELVVFRVVQESLTNVHRHSGSSWAKIRLTRSEKLVEFEIIDGGGGISAERQGELRSARSGVGVRGMEERVRQFRGTMKILSDEGGTRVQVKLPVEV